MANKASVGKPSERKFRGLSFDQLATDHVEVGSCVVLPELDSAGVPLEDLLDELGDSARPRVRPRVVPLDPRLVHREASLDRVRQDLDSIRALVDVVLDVLNEPPRSVSAVVPRRAARVEQVRDETVLEHRSEREDVVSRGGERAGGEEQSSEGDEDLQGKVNSEQDQQML